MHKNIIMFDMDGTLLDLAYDDFIWHEQQGEGQPIASDFFLF